MDDIISTALAINNTLKDISISGREDIRRLLACMEAIDRIVGIAQEVLNGNNQTKEQ